MLRFAWWSLRSRWSRIVTLCLGLICVSICTTLLAGLAQLSTLSADQQLSRAWQSAPYDLLVRAPAALSPVERELQVVDPTGPERHEDGRNFAFADGHAHFLRPVLESGGSEGKQPRSGYYPKARLE